jgi:hypothetical protein
MGWKTWGNQLVTGDVGQLGTIALDNGFDLKNFDKNLEVKILSRNNEAMEVELRGIDAPIANALRRIIIDEVSSKGPDRRHRQGGNLPEHFGYQRRDPGASVRVDPHQL